MLFDAFFVDGVERDLGDVSAVLFGLVAGNTQFVDNVGNITELSALCNLDICLHVMVLD